jgi:hypothetical protein
MQRQRALVAVTRNRKPVRLSTKNRKSVLKQLSVTFNRTLLIHVWLWMRCKSWLTFFINQISVLK